VPRLAHAGGRPWPLAACAFYLTGAIICGVLLSAVHERRVAKMCPDANDPVRCAPRAWPLAGALVLATSASAVLGFAGRGQFIESVWLLVAGSALVALGRSRVRAYRVLGLGLIAAAGVLAALQDARVAAPPSIAALVLWCCVMVAAVWPVAVLVNRCYVWQAVRSGREGDV